MKLKSWVKETIEAVACLVFFATFIFMFWLIFGV